MAERKRESFPCPNCGEMVPAGARACPHCGSDEETGWADDAEESAIDLPDEADDAGPKRMSLWVLVLAAIALLAMLILSLTRG